MERTNAMTRRAAFILNGQAAQGGGRAWFDANRRAVESVAAGGLIVVAEGGEAIQDATRRALDTGCEVIVAGGGDGTLNAVASKVIHQPVDFGVLPLGTLNHFAKDAGIPLDPLVALQSIAVGHVSAIDVGEVNGTIFLNNSSIGLYVDLVRDRDRQQLRLGRGKWAAFAWALVGALRRYPFMDVELGVDGKVHAYRTPFVFVGNNAYEIEGLQIGRRAELRNGVLSAYVAERAGRWRLFELGVRALVGRIRQERDFQVFVGNRLRIETRHRELRVAIDGELRQMRAPLQYRILPRALRVIVPATRG
ncbi:MAG: diacylglycerol kinase family protein [Caldimonas sp.]